MNRMKSFWKILLQREATAIVIAGIICVIVTTAMYKAFSYYMQDYYYEAFNCLEEKLDKALDGEVVAGNEAKIGFKLAVETEMINGVAYWELEDEATGEIVTNSDRKGYLILRDKNTEEKASMYAVDLKYIQPLLKYDTTDNYYRFYYWMPEEGITFLGKLGTRYYTFEVKDAYRGDEIGYPRTICVSGTDITFMEEELLDTIVLEPEDTTGLKLVEKGEDYTVLFVVVGHSYKPEISNLEPTIINEPLGENDKYALTCGSDSTFITGKSNFYGKLRYVDSSGKAYIAHLSAVMDFKSLYICIIVINGLILIIAIVVALILAKKHYLRMKYEYGMTEYQNNLIDIMAHDLRTPLMAMSGYAENLKEEANADKRDYYIDAILKNTEHMSQIISNNLNVSKIGNEDIRKNETNIDLVAMLEESLEQYKVIFDERKITINCNGAFEIKGSENMMKTAVDNLVSNIVKYVDDAGTVTIAVTGKKLVISNTTKEIIKNPKKLWEPFVRGNESRSNVDGTGLGLAIAKNGFDKHKLKSSIEVKDGVFSVLVVKRK